MFLTNISKEKNKQVKFNINNYNLFLKLSFCSVAFFLAYVFIFFLINYLSHAGFIDILYDLAYNVDYFLGRAIGVIWLFIFVPLLLLCASLFRRRKKLDDEQNTIFVIKLLMAILSIIGPLFSGLYSLAKVYASDPDFESLPDGFIFLVIDFFVTFIPLVILWISLHKWRKLLIILFFIFLPICIGISLVLKFSFALSNMNFIM